MNPTLSALSALHVQAVQALTQFARPEEEEEGMTPGKAVKYGAGAAALGGAGYAAAKGHQAVMRNAAGDLWERGSAPGVRESYAHVGRKVRSAMAGEGNRVANLTRNAYQGMRAVAPEKGVTGAVNEAAKAAARGGKQIAKKVVRTIFHYGDERPLTAFDEMQQELESALMKYAL